MSKKATIESVTETFTSAANIPSEILKILFVAVSLGLLLIFGIFIILKKARRGGEMEEQGEFYRIIVIFVIAVTAVLLYQAMTTTG